MQIETVEKVGVIIIFWIVLAFAGTILVRLAIGIPWARDTIVDLGHRRIVGVHCAQLDHCGLHR